MGVEQLELVAVVGVLLIVAASYLAPKFGVATPIALVVLGLGLSFLPGLPPLAPHPELILAGVLPPLLYSAAVNMPAVDFRRDLRTIGALSVVLVLVSAFGTGALLWWIFPDLGLAAAVAVGAVISPPDAVAATSIGKRLGLPPRLLTILEGEGLVNDATALVLLRTAVLGAMSNVRVNMAGLPFHPKRESILAACRDMERQAKSLERKARALTRMREGATT